MAKSKWKWYNLFANIELDDIEDMYMEDYDVDRIFEELFPSFKGMIESGELNPDELYKCIEDYIRVMEWKKCDH
jgi:hypothetical protein